MASYRIRGREGQFQYEEFHDLRFTCGKYGHREEGYPSMLKKKSSGEEQGGNGAMVGEETAMAEPPE